MKVVVVVVVVWRLGDNILGIFYDCLRLRGVFSFFHSLVLLVCTLSILHIHKRLVISLSPYRLRSDGCKANPLLFSSHSKIGMSM